MDHRPPTIGVVGLTGAGKSSTVNALFGTDLPVSHSTPCTRQFRVLDVPAGRDRRAMRVIDAPGLGEDDRHDDAYLGLYRRHLPKCDVVLWVLAARNRATALDRRYLEALAPFRARLVFGVNQLDLIGPTGWANAAERRRNRLRVVEDRRAALAVALGCARPLVGYSAARGDRLPDLLAAILASCPRDRARRFPAAT